LKFDASVSDALIYYFVFFAPGSASLDPPARTVVADAAGYAKVYPFAPITVTGHGDPSAGPKRRKKWRIDAPRLWQKPWPPVARKTAPLRR